MKKPSSVLEQIRIASPCSASWEAMKGDERVRFCGECGLHVYNLSAMGREEAEAFVAGREGRTCVRFFRREDGTVLTRDCPVGVKALRQRLVRAVAALAGVVIGLVSGTLFGGVVQRFAPSGLSVPSEAFARWIDPTPRSAVMGGTCPPMGKLVLPPPSCGEEPAETPLLEPTAEQMEAIRRRLGE